MKIPTTQPPRLKAGDTIAIVAPAGPIDNSEDLRQGAAALESMGFRVRFDERILQASRYLAGIDSARAEELMRSFEDPSVHAIMALRGGYGSSRLIPLLEEKRLRPHPKSFMGFSDLTTLLLFFQRRFGWVTFHGPMAASSTLNSFSPEQKNHLLSLWTDPDYRPTLTFSQLESWTSGVAEGVLTGGCLSIIEASIGTSYEIDTEGKILFLEDQGEPPYRLDRMLTHLRLAGKLKSPAGILLGSFRDCEPSQGDYTAADILRDLLTGLGIPIVANFPAGHIKDNWVLPFGIKARIDADAPSVTLIDAAVR
ncbi:MAG TPA: LD-carboxypeptidase [Acidobacteriota bacterium]|nr:LD-carboxypeptidase [Acidobacteriota bacterium]